MVSSTEVATEPTGPSPGDPLGASTPTTARRFGVSLAAIAAGGAVVRFGYTIWARNQAVLSDGLHYSSAARYLADGRGFINPLALVMSGSDAPDAVHPPAWTSVLSVVALAGRRSDFDFKLVAATVGVATVVMVGLAARAAFGDRVGLIAAGIAALYANLWLYERELVSEPLALLGIATVIWLTYRFRDAPNGVRAVALGFLVAICALTRAELILLSVLVVAPTILLVRTASLPRRAGWLALAGVGCLALIAPWFAYNTTRFEAPVPLSAGLGGAMTAGNCDTTFDPSNDRFAYYHFGCAIFSGPVSADGSVADNQRRATALNYIKAHKTGFLVTATARLGRTFSVYAPFQQVGFEGERGSTPWVLDTALFSYWVLLPFGVLGGIEARRRRVPLYPLLALVLIVFVAVVPTIGAVRYRAPAEITLVILAAVGIDAVVRRWSNRRTAASGPAGTPDRAAPERPQPPERRPSDGEPVHSASTVAARLGVNLVQWSAGGAGRHERVAMSS